MVFSNESRLRISKVSPTCIFQFTNKCERIFHLKNAHVCMYDKMNVAKKKYSERKFQIKKLELVS